MRIHLEICLVTPVCLCAAGLVLCTAIPAQPACLFPAGPLPGAAAPVAVAVDSTTGLVLAVHRKFYSDVQVNAEALPTDMVSLVNETTGAVITTIPLGKALNGAGQGIAVDPTRGRAFIGNEDDNTVTVLDTTAKTVVNTTTVGQAPLGIAVDSATGLVAVANSSSSSLSVLSADTGVVVRTVGLGGGAYSVVLDTSSHLAYVLVRTVPWSVVAVNLQTGTIQGSLTLSFLYTLQQIAVDAGSRAYVTDSNSGLVSVIDLSGGTMRELARFTGGQRPVAISVDPPTHTVYVGDGSTDKVNIFDRDGNPIKSMNVMRRPSGIAIDAGRRKAFVSNTLSDSLSVVDLTAQDVVNSFLLGTFTPGLTFDPGAGRIYATNFMGDSVAVIDATSQSLLAQWQSGAYPWTVAVDPGQHQLYVINTGEDTLSVFSTTNGQIAARLSIGKPDPGELAISASHRVYITSGNALQILDGTTNQLGQPLSLGQRPVGVAIDDAAGLVYVANQQSGTISVLNQATNALIATWNPTLSNVWELAVDPGLHQLYVTIPVNTIGSFNGVEILDSGTGQFLGQIATGGRAAKVVVNPATHQVFVTDTDANTVTVIDGISRTAVSTVPVGQQPNGMAMDVQNAVLYTGNQLDGTISCLSTNTSLAAITVTTTPPGLGLTVDGKAYTAPQAFQWAVASSHTVSVGSPQISGGTRYVFGSWSDGQPGTHTVIAPAASTTYTAAFTTQYLLTTVVSPAAAGSVAVNPLSADGYYNAGASVQLTPLPGAGFTFAGWSGDLSGAANPAVLTMSAPRSVTAGFGATVFTLNPPSTVVGAAAGSGSVAVVASTSSGTWTAASNMAWITITSEASGAGSGTVVFSVAANNSVNQRIGTLAIAGQNFTITQSGTTGVLSSRFVPIIPCRVIDTRGQTGPFGLPIMAAGTSRTFPIAASPCGIPATGVAYSFNVTVVPANILQYLTIWPTGQPQPTVSTLNSFDGRIVANAAIVPAGSNGSVDVFVTDQTHVIIDINGYFDTQNPSALSFFPAAPCRIADTRGGFTGAFGPPAMAAGTERDFPVPSSPCGLPGSAGAYSLNVTVVPSGPLNYLAAWPAGRIMPFVSTLNSPDGSVVANAAVVPTGTSGAISVFVTNQTDVILDANGYFATTGTGTPLSFYPVAPCRVADTRGAAGMFGAPSLAANTTRTFPIPLGGCGVPAVAQAYSLNMTVVPAGPLSYLTLWPTGQSRPNVSTLNSFTARVVANAAIVPAGTSGSVNVFVTNPAEVIIDINGYFAP